jgi:hypothetical protein
MRKHKKPLKRSFVITFAGTASLAALAAGCQVSTTNPPMVDCPVDAPQADEACDQGDAVGECSYEEEDGCSISANCSNGEWLVHKDVDTCGDSGQ